MHLFRKYDGSKELEIPIKVLNQVHPLPRACVVRPQDGKNKLLIATLKGVREYQFEMIGPEHLLEILKEIGYKLILPERRDHGKT